MGEKYISTPEEYKKTEEISEDVEQRRIKVKEMLEKIKKEDHLVGIKTKKYGSDYHGYINEVLEDSVIVRYKNYGPSFMSTEKINFDDIELIEDRGQGRAGHDYL